MEFIYSCKTTRARSPRPVCTSVARPYGVAPCLLRIYREALRQFIARAFDAVMDPKRKPASGACLFQTLYWIAGALAFLGALMALAHIAFTHSIR